MPPSREQVLAALVDVWRHDDWFRLTDDVAGHYVNKASVCAEVMPQTVIEIGTRCGYSLAAFAVAAPMARYLCIDGGLDDDSPACLRHWHAVQTRRGIDAQLVVVDTQHVRELPRADFAHVDGDHSYGGALRDLRLVASCPTILADDVCNPHVRRAVLEFCEQHKRPARWIDDGLRQCAVIT